MDREQLKNRQRKLPMAEVPTPEWGGVALVRVLTAAELDDFETTMFEGEGKDRRAVNVRAKMVCRAVCNEDGSRVFLDEDSDWLGREPATVIDRLFEAAQKLSGRSEQEAIEKN